MAFIRLRGIPNELERDDLLQPLQFPRAVETIARGIAARPKQTQAVVVMQSPHGHSG